MVLIIARILRILFFSYTALLFLRVISSWVPSLGRHRIMYFVRAYTDPYLNLFRRLIPPIGGALDLSPIIGFFALELIERMVMGILRGLL